MLGYDYSIVYRRGTQNIMADALTRKPSVNETQLFQCTGNRTLTWFDLWEQIIETNLKDPTLQRLCKKVQQHLMTTLSTLGMVQFFEGKGRWL